MSVLPDLSNNATLQSLSFFISLSFTTLQGQVLHLSAHRKALSTLPVDEDFQRYYYQGGGKGDEIMETREAKIIHLGIEDGYKVERSSMSLF